VQYLVDLIGTTATSTSTSTTSIALTEIIFIQAKAIATGNIILSIVALSRIETMDHVSGIRTVMPLL
jgi:hypothetical protein